MRVVVIIPTDDTKVGDQGKPLGAPDVLGTFMVKFPQGKIAVHLSNVKPA